jgi:hypothetical protein
MRRALLAAAVLAASPAAAQPAGWPGYPVLMWQDQPPAAWTALRALGVDGGKVFGTRDDRAPIPALPAPFASGARFYVENVATDFYAAYHRWTPGQPVNRAFQQERAAPTWRRSPSLSDRVWLARVAARLDRTVRAYAPDRPLYYDLGDETGIAELAAFWDFDVSQPSADGFRRWLRTRYPSIAALNAEWGAAYAGFDDVQPELTDAAMARDDDDFAAWSDFKEWMDEAFARAVRAGTDAVHRADPAALAAIEGAQAPGWGGYDYARLAPAVDVMELYDAGGSVALARAFNPRLAVLGTAFGLDEAARRGVWRELLRGGRGLILWDEAGEIVRPDGADGPLAPAARALIPQLKQAAAWLAGAAEPESAVAVLYSPASFRAQWMLDRRPRGAAWRDRSAAGERGDAAGAALAATIDALQHFGLRPHVVSPATLAAGALTAHGDRLLVLPRAQALSDAEADAIRSFQAAGGAVVAEGEAGAFDEHLKRRPAPALAPAGLIPLDPSQRDFSVLLGFAAGDAGVRPAAYVASRDAEVRVLRRGADLLVAVQRDLGTPDGPRTLVLAEPATITDLSTGATSQASGWTTLDLDPVRPTFLRLSARAPQ